MTCRTCLLAIRDDLTAIGDNQLDLRLHAVTAARDGRLAAAAPIPGGDALVATGPASPVTHHRLAWWCTDHDTADDLHPLLTLAAWAQVWREWLREPDPERVTIGGEAAWLRVRLPVMGAAVQRVDPDDPARLEVAPDLADMAHDLRVLRRRCEDLTRTGAGDHDQRLRVPCLTCGARLDRAFGDSLDTDGAVCGRCRRTYDGRALLRAQAAWVTSRNKGEAFIELKMAAEALERSPWTLRSWIRDGDVTVCCLLSTRTIAVWWPDVRRLDRLRVTRRRSGHGLASGGVCA